jgi:hypothetical protein
MDEASYSSDLALSDFYLLGSLKKYLAGKRFAADADVKQALTSWLEELHADFLNAEIHAWVQSWKNT